MSSRQIPASPAVLSCPPDRLREIDVSALSEEEARLALVDLYEEYVSRLKETVHFNIGWSFIVELFFFLIFRDPAGDFLGESFTDSLHLRRAKRLLRQFRSGTCREKTCLAFLAEWQESAGPSAPQEESGEA